MLQHVHQAQFSITCTALSKTLIQLFHVTNNAGKHLTSEHTEFSWPLEHETCNFNKQL